MDLNGLEQVLKDLEVETTAIDSILKSYAIIKFDKTKSRTSVAYMNDATKNYKHSLNFSGEINLDIRELNRKLNKQPMKALDWKYPIESLREQMLKVINNKA